jgi:hypothetical protein
VVQAIYGLAFCPKYTPTLSTLTISFTANRKYLDHLDHLNPMLRIVNVYASRIRCQLATQDITNIVGAAGGGTCACGEFVGDRKPLRCLNA